MDDLFNSRKLFTAGYHVKVLCHGVFRTYGCGLCEATIQKTETDIKKADLLRGSTKCAILQDDKTCPNLICASVYDTKPVHLLSTVSSTVEWKEMKRTVYSPIKNPM